jgi:hypothetical protein
MHLPRIEGAFDTAVGMHEIETPGYDKLQVAFDRKITWVLTSVQMLGAARKRGTPISIFVVKLANTFTSKRTARPSAWRSKS